MADDFPEFVTTPILVSTSADGPDILPQVYTIDQLKAWIYRQLGGGMWNVELTPQNVVDNIIESLRKYSKWRPRVVYGTITMTPSITKYLQDIDVGQGIVDCVFVENRATPGILYYGNLLPQVPLPFTGMGEYDTYQRWQKTWMRVTSVRPDWLYDTTRKCLWIHNPISRYLAAVLSYGNYTKTQDLDTSGQDWVKDYALARSKKQLGEMYKKFGGAIPGPVQDLILDQSKQQTGIDELTKLEADLRGSQEISPLSID